MWSAMVAMILLSLTALTAHIMYDLQVLTFNFSFFLFCTIFHSFLKIYAFCINHLWIASLPLPYNPNAIYEMLLPTFIPTPVLVTTMVGLVITPLQQTHPSVFLLSPSTHLHRHKHGTALATVSHLKETVTMVGVPYIIYLILCFQKHEYVVNAPRG